MFDKLQSMPLIFGAFKITGQGSIIPYKHFHLVSFINVSHQENFYTCYLLKHEMKPNDVY